MADLPAELVYGKVVWTAILGVADTGDVGRNPDAVAAQGTVTFTPAVANIKVTTPDPVTVVKQPITCTLDANGVLTDPMGAEGVWLVTGVWNVAYSMTGNVLITSHDIDVLDTHTDVAPLDLTTAIPAGTPIAPSQYAELSSRVDALEAAPPGSAPDATTTTKGIVQLAGDLAGTAAAPTVPGLAGKALNTVTITAGTGLTGGGDLTANRTLTVAYGTTSTTAAVGNDSRITGAAQKASNLSDLANVATARTNLGLGTAATTASTAYATAAQGATADTALQPATAQVVNAQTGTSYTLVAGDAGKVVTLSNTGAITLNAPGSVFTAGQRVDVVVINTGMATVVGTSGATANGTPSLVSRARWSAFTILWLSSTSAVVIGDLA